MTLLSRALLTLALLGLGAILLYFGVIFAATLALTSTCHGAANGSATITITQYNFAPEIHCYRR